MVERQTKYLYYNYITNTSYLSNSLGKHGPDIRRIAFLDSLVHLEVTGSHQGIATDWARAKLLKCSKNLAH